MSDRLPTILEYKLLEQVAKTGRMDIELWATFSDDTLDSCIRNEWVNEGSDALFITYRGREALVNYAEERMFAAVAPEVQFVDAGRPDPADDVTRYDADLARLVAAVQPFRAWAEMIEGDGKTVLVDKTVWTPTDAQTVKITAQDLHMLLATIDDVVSKGELK